MRWENLAGSDPTLFGCVGIWSPFRSSWIFVHFDKFLTISSDKVTIGSFPHDATRDLSFASRTTRLQSFSESPDSKDLSYQVGTCDMNRAPDHMFGPIMTKAIMVSRFLIHDRRYNTMHLLNT